MCSCRKNKKANTNKKNPAISDPLVIVSSTGKKYSNKVTSKQIADQLGATLDESGHICIGGDCPDKTVIKSKGKKYKVKY